MQADSSAATLPALIEASSITVRRGDVPVLDHVDLTLSAGEIVCIIGPNGSGKTTLLRALLGLIAVQDGKVRRRTGLRIGYMPQRLAIDPTLPITLERFLGLSRNANAAARRQAMQNTGIAHLADRPMQGLSGGETQRALLARALLNEPDLLMLDEPAQGVDVNGQVELYELIGRIRRDRGCAVLMVSHDLHLVMAATDRVICLNGHICCTGHPEDVSRDPAYLSLFGPRAAQALAVYQHHHDHHHTPGGGVVPLHEDSTVEQAASDHQHGHHHHHG
ncbi:MAG: zinc ABC transporter ATP-binding protein ZnuC [Oceanibaculum nanhaiense]|uniref:zinc ABC transporter ATP-binding protein ZnuC n=1 Tax=Oceanibaculum nanhaiense TaxID=1909734 RepID=UPI0025A3C673|nr:zinc ABC transporter ATP-binding protein ZnuC [Oceanibaculum nanhaiense]MDM7946267.1 zinc ABC transporter ATP-binding protein ZnuC [Oceanibaculum nanhaiense]